ncbi:hypothetical protein HU718_012410 [Pseudomonas tensinigenes]|uniref:AbiV family abortive infection protein n=1 Tax=Pseudomonas tensinigenes TaxID=2745511 RepID=A0ABX8Q454_9PSED|nr:hypothetical protein [Pseudomonas tensinigenes]QXI08465.1 hypothetical protein HU718_012410 [Pseudomonas tensinigenes]
MEFSGNAFDFEQYRDSMVQAEKNITNSLPEAVWHLKKCDHLILSTLENLGSNESRAAAAHSHSLYLAACNLALGAHLSAIFPLLRTAMESAVYGYLFNREPGLYQSWLNRHDNEDSFLENKKSFTPAMKRFRKYLREHDEQSTGTPYEYHIMGLYDAAIDFGAHPNPIALTNATTVEQHEEFEKFKYDYLRVDYSSVAQGIVAIYEYAQAIAMINHFSRMCVTPETEGLDNMFLEFVKETNEICDKLNGNPIGFNSRHYSQINNLVKRP